MHLEHKQFKNINLEDSFFDSLKKDYAEFSKWFTKKAEDRAYVFPNEQGTLEGFLYLKTEDGPLNDVVPALPAACRIKVGTMKINAHGTKLGQRFMKKIFDHALYEKVKEIYVTVFAHHESLVNLFQRYGFTQRATKTTPNGTELVLVRDLRQPYEDVVASYPLVRMKHEQVYLLSLYPKWHTRLLPDSILKNEDTDIVQDVSHTNSIHKVYLASMRGLEVLKRGDILLIYRTSDGAAPAKYRSVATSICVMEEYRTIYSFRTRDEFLDYCRPYSVFTEQELEDFWLRKTYHHVLRFTYNIALKKRVTRGTMIDDVGLRANDYWGFMALTHDQLLQISRKGMIDESLIIH